MVREALGFIYIPLEVIPTVSFPDLYPNFSPLMILDWKCHMINYIVIGCGHHLRRIVVLIEIPKEFAPDAFICIH